MHVSESILERLICEWLIRTDIIDTMIAFTWIPVKILELMHENTPDSMEGPWLCVRRVNNGILPSLLMKQGNRMNRATASDAPFKSLTYQLGTVGYWPTVAVTGNGELGFDSGEGA